MEEKRIKKKVAIENKVLSVIEYVLQRTDREQKLGNNAPDSSWLPQKPRSIQSNQADMK